MGMGSHRCIDHTQDAGVLCSHDSACEEDRLRLVPNDLTAEQLYLREGELESFNFIRDKIHRGRVEMCEGGNWRSICYNELWGDDAATLACGRLDFSPYGKY